MIRIREQKDIDTLSPLIEETSLTLKNCVNTLAYLKEYFTQAKSDISDLELLSEKREDLGNSYTTQKVDTNTDSDIEDVDTEKLYYEKYESLTELSKKLSDAIQISSEYSKSLVGSFSKFNSILDTEILEKLEKLG